MMNESFAATVHDGIQDALNDYAGRNGLPRLAWSLDREGRINGHASRGDYDDPEQAPVVEMWATHLNLVEQGHLVPAHMREWYGESGQLPVVLWTVTDWEAWEARTNHELEADTDA